MTSLGRAWRRLLFAWVVGHAIGGLPAAEVPKGRLLEKVACASDAKQTYALYVPTTFDRTRRWPVIFCFDPGARGRTPVERFLAAAEKYGYIVAASNNSRNGPWEANLAAITAMLGDVNRYFPIDPKRIYAAGLSGGARVASQLAISGVAQGLIACSAGFIGSQTPGTVKFPVYGTAGATDFNYLELRRVDRELDERRAAHRIVFHSGGHEWLSSELALDALAWLDLQSMRRGEKEKDPAWIQAQFAARLAAVPAQPVTERHRALQGLVADFKELADVRAPEKQAAELAASREFRDGAKQERAAERREESRGADLLAAIHDAQSGVVRKIAAGLQTESARTDTPDGQRALRVLQNAYTHCAEAARESLRQEDYTEAEPWLEMMTILRPERAQPHFDLARCAAFLGEKKRALAALQEAVKAGFKDAARLEAEKAFAPLQRDPAYQQLIATLRSDPGK